LCDVTDIGFLCGCDHAYALLCGSAIQTIKRQFFACYPPFFSLSLKGLQMIKQISRMIPIDSVNPSKYLPSVQKLPQPSEELSY
jgi:hypothetical protein